MVALDATLPYLLPVGTYYRVETSARKTGANTATVPTQEGYAIVAPTQEMMRVRKTKDETYEPSEVVASWELKPNEAGKLKDRLP